MLEKPIGHDLASAREINDAVGAVFDETQIFRIDHYLGKESVQNLLVTALRQHLPRAAVERATASTTCRSPSPRPSASAAAATTTTTPARCATWCRTTCCSCSAWSRWSRRRTSAARPSATRSSRCSRRCKPITGDRRRPRRRRGQYRRRPRRRQRRAVVPDDAGHAGSTTETFVALKAEVQNWRWAGVPFYLRTGKRMDRRVSEIVVHFKDVAALDVPGQRGHQRAQPAAHPGPARRGHAPAPAPPRSPARAASGCGRSRWTSSYAADVRARSSPTPTSGC